MTDSNPKPTQTDNPAPEHSSPAEEVRVATSSRAAARLCAALPDAFDIWPNLHLLRVQTNGAAADGQWRDTPLTCDEAQAHAADGGMLGLVPWSVGCVVVVCRSGSGTDWPRGKAVDVRTAALGAIGSDPLLRLTGRDAAWAYSGHLYYPAAEPVADRGWAVDGRRGGVLRSTGFVTLWDRRGFAQYVQGDDAAYASVTSGSGGLTTAMLDHAFPQQQSAEPDPPPPDPPPAPAPDPDDATPDDATYAADRKPVQVQVPPSELDPVEERMAYARTAADIVDTMWFEAWRRYCGRGDPPPPPSVPELERWLGDCQWSLPHDTALFQALAQWDRTQSGGEHILGDVILMLHGRWLRPYRAGLGFPDEHHPIAPLIRRRLALAVPGTPYAVRDKASLPRVHKAGGANILLPILFPMDAPPAQPSLDLPPISAGSDRLCPHWLLWLYDQAGGISMRQGRGAPWALRLFIGALLHMPVEDRDGQFHTYRLPLYPDPEWPDIPDVISWLFPNGRRWANRVRDWQKLPRALDAIRKNLSHVPVTGADGERYLLSLLVPTVIPDSPKANLIEFMIRLPGAAAGGARLDWHALCEYGTEGAVLYRAYLSAVAQMDRSARGGHPITRQIASPIVGSDGKPIRGRGGRVARSKVDTMPNPASRYVPALTDFDLTRIIGLDPTNRRRRRRARAAFERLDEDGHIEIVREGGGKVRIFGPKGGGG